MNKVRLQEVMAKTSVAQSVCYWNHAGETIKKKFKKKSLKKESKEGGSKRGGKLGREVIRHYISDNLTVPSATGAANCFHREQRGNNVLFKRVAAESPVENTHGFLFSHRTGCVVQLKPKISLFEAFRSCNRGHVRLRSHRPTPDICS